MQPHTQPTSHLDMQQPQPRESPVSMLHTPLTPAPSCSMNEMPGIVHTLPAQSATSPPSGAPADTAQCPIPASMLHQQMGMQQVHDMQRHSLPAQRATSPPSGSPADTAQCPIPASMVHQQIGVQQGHDMQRQQFHWDMQKPLEIGPGKSSCSSRGNLQTHSAPSLFKWFLAPPR